MSDRSDAGYLEYVNGRLPTMRRMAHLLCGHPDQADDLVQETITKLYARWPRISQADNIDAYVHTMIVRAFLDEKRRGWWRVGLFAAAPDGVIAVTLYTRRYIEQTYLWLPDGTARPIDTPEAGKGQATRFRSSFYRSGWFYGTVATFESANARPSAPPSVGRTDNSSLPPARVGADPAFTRGPPHLLAVPTGALRARSQPFFGRCRMLVAHFTSVGAPVRHERDHWSVGWPARSLDVGDCQQVS